MFVYSNAANNVVVENERQSAMVLVDIKFLEKKQNEMDACIFCFNEIWI